MDFYIECCTKYLIYQLSYTIDLKCMNTKIYKRIMRNF
jgi:hypothetical protein